MELIVAKNLSKKFGDFVAVNGIDITVNKGESFGFLGPNGAGKSSTMRIIAATSQRSGGEIKILDKDPEKFGPQIRAHLGVLAIPAAALIAFAFASIGMALTSYFKSYQQLGLVEVFLLPIFLFSGSLFPTEILPSWANLIVKISPLWHAIDLLREIIYFQISSKLLIHVSYFLFFSFVGLAVVTIRLRKLFID